MFEARAESPPRLANRMTCGRAAKMPPSGLTQYSTATAGCRVCRARQARARNKLLPPANDVFGSLHLAGSHPARSTRGKVPAGIFRPGRHTGSQEAVKVPGKAGGALGRPAAQIAAMATCRLAGSVRGQRRIVVPSPGQRTVCEQAPALWQVCKRYQQQQKHRVGKTGPVRVSSSLPAQSLP